MKNKQLSIRLHGEPVGILEQNSAGTMSFKYLKEAARTISIGLPIREEPYEGLQCEAFFGGLLPESQHVRKILGKRFHVSAENSFALLKEIGYDCAGAISCHAIDEPIKLENSFAISGKIVTDNELYQHIKLLPQKPLFMDFEGLRLSLAGVQDKAAVCIIDKQITLPQNGCPTTHLLKPSSEHYSGLEVNEYFCLKIAKRIGLPVPNVELRQIKDCVFLLVERYDRHIRNNYIERIHQEDFCQALGVLTSRKYQNEGGPGFIKIFDLLKTTARPAKDRVHLASVLVFNYLIGNMDAHGKNFSLLNYPSGITLAPFYDLVCTHIYDKLTIKMAMKIGSKYEADQVFPRHWKQLCSEINYRYLAIEKLIKELGEKILKAATQEKAECKNLSIDTVVIDRVINFIEHNIEKTLIRFQNNNS